jgi:hypothetical protein
VIEITVKAAGNGPPIPRGAILQLPDTCAIEAVEVLFREASYPGPDEAGIKKLSKTLIRCPPAPEVEPRELARRCEPQLTDRFK